MTKDRDLLHAIETTESELRQCFADYVGAGVFADVDLDECHEITTTQMCKALIRTAHTKG